MWRYSLAFISFKSFRFLIFQAFISCLCFWSFIMHILYFSWQRWLMPLSEMLRRWRFVLNMSSFLVSSGYLLEEIVILKDKQNEVEEHMKKLLNVLPTLKTSQIVKKFKKYTCTTEIFFWFFFIFHYFLKSIVFLGWFKTLLNFNQVLRSCFVRFSGGS